MTDERAMTDEYDVLVIGGGPVGACVGALLVQGVGRGAATPFRGKSDIGIARQGHQKYMPGLQFARRCRCTGCDPPTR